MSNFENIKKVWNDLDGIREKKFPQLSNTELFKKLLGFTGDQSGISNIRARIMQDLEDDASVFSEFSNFMTSLTEISDQLEAGIGMDESVPPSQIFERIQSKVLAECNSEGRLNAGSTNNDVLLTVSDVQAGALDVMQDNLMRPEELLATGCVFNFTVIDADDDIVSVKVAQDPNGYITFCSADLCNQWVLGKLKSQSSIEECTEFERAVLVYQLYAISAKNVQAPIAFLSEEYFKLLSGDKRVRGEERLTNDLCIDLGDVKVNKDVYKSTLYEYEDTLGDKNLVAVVK